LKVIKYLLYFYLLLYFSPVDAQANYTDEFGFLIGFTSIQTDYGQRTNFASNYDNNGVDISLVYYRSFYSRKYKWDRRSTWFNDHFRMRAELSYMTGHFKHFGKYVDASQTSPTADELRAMSGTTKIISLGTSLEFYFKGIADYYYDPLWKPYISTGFLINSYKPSVSSTLGDWKTDITVLPNKYRTPNAVKVNHGITFSYTFGGGIRRALNSDFDLLLDSRVQYFFTNYIDGLNAHVPENKHNDWLVLLNFGIIYHAF